MFDWNDLRHFLAVARAGSTIAAAKTLGTSQSTVHRRLAVLEVQIGRRLFNHDPKGYRLTETGNRLLPYAERAEEAMTAFERQCLASDQELTGKVRVTCTAAVADRMIKSLLIDRFHAGHPGLQVELIINHRVLDLSKGEADVAIRAGSPRYDMLVGRMIMDLPRAVYASRSYIERHGRPARPEDLDNHCVIAFDGETANSDPARWLRSVAPHAIVTARVDSWPGLLAAISSGIGVGVLPVYIGDSERELARLINPVPELMTHLWLLVHPDLQHTPRVRAFLDFAIAECKTFRAMLSTEGGHNSTAAVPT